MIRILNIICKEIIYPSKVQTSIINVNILEPEDKPNLNGLFTLCYPNRFNYMHAYHFLSEVECQI